MSTSKAILIGSGAIAVAVIGSTALVITQRPTDETARRTEAAAPTVSPAPVNASGRYQIAQVDDGVSWRLDTRTGEMTACRLEGVRMTCVSSDSAAPATAGAPLAPEAGRDQDDDLGRSLKKRSAALLDRVFTFFDHMLDRAEHDHSGSAPPPVSGDTRQL